MRTQFEKWVPDALSNGNSMMAVFHHAMSSECFRRGQVKFMLDNPDAAEKVGITQESLKEARDAYEGDDWDSVTTLEVYLPE